MRETVVVEVGRARREDVEIVGAALARAFEDDPVFRWIVPDNSQRREQLPAFFTTFASFFLTHDETYLAGRGAGAAVWAPAGVEPIAEDHAEAFGERVAAILEENVARGWQLQELLEKHHPERPAFYLQFLGVIPEEQGRGIGGRLLETVLTRCDAARIPAYLEATSSDNRRLYARHGFATLGEIPVPHGPTLWSMWRDPIA